MLRGRSLVFRTFLLLTLVFTTRTAFSWWNYVLAGSPDGRAPIRVDDDIKISLKTKAGEETLVEDVDGEESVISPLQFYADEGDVIVIVAKNKDGDAKIHDGKSYPRGYKELSPIWLINLDTGEKVLLTGGVPRHKSDFIEQEEFFKLNYTIGVKTVEYCLSSVPNSCRPIWVEDDMPYLSVELRSPAGGSGGEAVSYVYKMEANPDSDARYGSLDLKLALPVVFETVGDVRPEDYRVLVQMKVVNHRKYEKLSPIYLVPLTPGYPVFTVNDHSIDNGKTCPSDVRECVKEGKLFFSYRRLLAVLPSGVPAQSEPLIEFKDVNTLGIWDKVRRLEWRIPEGQVSNVVVFTTSPGEVRHYYSSSGFWKRFEIESAAAAYSDAMRLSLSGYGKVDLLLPDMNAYQKALVAGRHDLGIYVVSGFGQGKLFQSQIDVPLDDGSVPEGGGVLPDEVLPFEVTRQPPPVETEDWAKAVMDYVLGTDLFKGVASTEGITGVENATIFDIYTHLLHADGNVLYGTLGEYLGFEEQEEQQEEDTGSLPWFMENLIGNLENATQSADNGTDNETEQATNSTQDIYNPLKDVKAYPTFVFEVPYTYQEAVDLVKQISGGSGGSSGSSESGVQGKHLVGAARLCFVVLPDDGSVFHAGYSLHRSDLIFAVRVACYELLEYLSPTGNPETPEGEGSKEPVVVYLIQNAPTGDFLPVWDPNTKKILAYEVATGRVLDPATMEVVYENVIVKNYDGSDATGIVPVSTGPERVYRIENEVREIDYSFEDYGITLYVEFDVSGARYRLPFVMVDEEVGSLGYVRVPIPPEVLGLSGVRYRIVAVKDLAGEEVMHTDWYDLDLPDRLVKVRSPDGYVEGLRIDRRATAGGRAFDFKFALKLEPYSEPVLPPVPDFIKAARVCIDFNEDGKAEVCRSMSFYSNALTGEISIDPYVVNPEDTEGNTISFSYWFEVIPNEDAIVDGEVLRWYHKVTYNYEQDPGVYITVSVDPRYQLGQPVAARISLTTVKSLEQAWSKQRVYDVYLGIYRRGRGTVWLNGVASGVALSSTDPVPFVAGLLQNECENGCSFTVNIPTLSSRDFWGFMFAGDYAFVVECKVVGGVANGISARAVAPFRIVEGL